MPRLLVLLCSLLAAQAITAEVPTTPSTAATRETLHAVIRSQLEAFRRGDFAAAYGFAAAGIRERFPIAAFTEMVKTSYPEIATNTAAVFGLAFDDGESAIVHVRVVAPGEVSRRFQYTLERADGAWRITGVVPLPANEPAI